MTRLAPAVLLLLAACSGGEDKPQQTAQSGSTGGGWNEPAKKPPQAKGEAPGTVFAANVDRDKGQLEVALPGGRISLDVPKDSFKFNDFDIDGTKLYPGSTVDSVSVKAREDGTGKDDDPTVRIRFTAPAAPDQVRAWFLSETAAKTRPLKAAGDALVGATEEGKAYRITLTPAGANRSAGEILIDG